MQIAFNKRKDANLLDKMGTFQKVEMTSMGGAVDKRPPPTSVNQV